MTALGIAFALEVRFAFFRMQSIEINPRGIVSDETLWGTASVLEERFWPLYWIAGKRHGKIISAYYPVSAKISLVGFGKFVINCKPLEPSFRLFWGGKYWYVSKDGKAWLASLPENRFLERQEADSLPPIYWSSDRHSPLDVADREGNVFVTSLPLSRIFGWYKNIEALDWRGKVKFIQAGIKEGFPAVNLIFFKNDGGNGFNILFADDPKNWQEAALAFKKIYPDIKKISEDIFIDTTYNGKILIKNEVR